MKTVVITGAASGMGLALVKRYVALGWDVIATRLESQDIPYPHAKVTWQVIDFLKDSLETWVAALPLSLDVFIANAGKGAYEINTPPHVGDDLYQLNALTPMHQFDLLKAKGFKGTFVVMGSIMAVWPLPGYARYSHTKGALVTYFKALQTTEKIPIVILMPVAVKTEFFLRSTQPHAPWLAQDADQIAIKFQRVIERKKKIWVSSKLFQLSRLLFPGILRIYLKRESKIYDQTLVKGEHHDYT